MDLLLNVGILVLVDELIVDDLGEFPIERGDVVEAHWKNLIASVVSFVNQFSTSFR